MELRQLRYFVGVAQHESFTRASEDLLIAQPALSAQVAKLEEELGVTLFERVGRRVRLTETGKLVLKQAKRALDASDDVARVARLGGDGVLGRLVVGYARVFPAREMTAILRAFRRRRPQVALDLREMQSSAQIALVRSGELDCGFVRLTESVEDDELTTFPISEYPAFVVVPRSHRLAKRRSVAMKELANEDWIMISRAFGESVFDDVIALCRRGGFAPRIAQEATDGRIALGFVAAGLGIAILSGAARELGVRGVHFAEVTPRHILRFGIVSRRDASSAALAALFGEVQAAAGFHNGSR
ncbi:MAG: LysR family transcriptional regulator [Candidatus Eremiobacteraeota bacterium]|nr:LysR family transcriptional regulator [Candidatus Eremiobacteraeota bacterium]